MNPSIYTKAVHDVHDSRHQGAVVFPIYQNSLFTFDRHINPGHPYYYSRGDNPTVQELEKKLAALEGGERARCFASGMAAISSSILSTVNQGDHIVCTNQVYPGTRQLLEIYLTRFGVETTFVAADSLEQIEAAIKPNTVLLYLESPTSFVFDLQDVRACAALAKKAKITTIIDNTWSTFCYQQPLSLGIDMVVHSLSKYIGGHSDAIGGVVIGTKEALERINAQEHQLLGGIMTPQTASLMLRGLRTLPLRMQRANETGLAVASYLASKPYLRLNYPGHPSHSQYKIGADQMTGFGSLMSFEINVSRETMYNWADCLKYYRIGCSWGGYESLVIVLGHPADFMSRTAEPKSCESALVRLFCGLEDSADLIADLEQAFKTLEDKQVL